MPHTTDDQDDGGEALGLESRRTAFLFQTPPKTKRVRCLGLPQAEVDDGLHEDADLE